ncbi:AAA family ATPase [Rhizobacter sp. Root404]|uniref:AAA family ATPase n=1 Tax=Rhizobacter sp. Root404 TaxID=1736528 RepID=UPI0009EA1950|nr:AAA family ATPase [Rhizobacter sp. Root404]
MYLDKVLMLNNGAIEDLTINADFFESGDPKPLVFVGINGSGKTNLLSSIADSLIEIAAEHFQDVSPSSHAGRLFYRVIGASTTRLGAAFDLTTIRFRHNENFLYYRSKAGTVEAGTLAARLTEFAPIASWKTTGNEKATNSGGQNIAEIYQPGAYVYFPANRSERPYWMNHEYEKESEATFPQKWDKRLGKPIVVQSTLDSIKPWLIDIILDQSVDAFHVIRATSLDTLRAQALPILSSINTYAAINRVLQAILGVPSARLVRASRTATNRRLHVLNDLNEPVIPSLDSMSSGQASLFALFLTLLKYGDTGTGISGPQIQGIAVIDEIDNHLHVDLQYNILPDLIRLFPKVQFIVSAHSPIFMLGMRRAFGDGNFKLIELPNGKILDPERYSDFQVSFDAFKETRKFENTVQALQAGSEKPLVLCEGETDPVYLRTAAALRGLMNLVRGVEFDWIGSKSPSGAKDGGVGALNSAYKILGNNPKLTQRKTVLLYDANEKVSPSLDGILVRQLPFNSQNAKCLAGIENLLPEGVLEERFYTRTEKRTADVAVIQKLQKVKLCESLCGVSPDWRNFENFWPFLEDLEKALFPSQSDVT